MYFQSGVILMYFASKILNWCYLTLCFIFIPANRCYYIVHSQVNWTSANSACKTAYPGASLATISNLHEQGMLPPGEY